MMKRKLAVILAATMMFFLPMVAHALGFGNLTLHSALNEPLDADIELLSPTEDDLANIKVKLASPDAFTRSGIDRTALLTELRFEVKEMDNGNYVVHLTTRVPVREPFLNFLLELEWQNGRMLREYTMLLDPPGIVKKQPAMVEAPAAAMPKVIEEPAPVETPFIEPEPVAALEPAPLPLETAQTETVEPAPTTEIAQPEPVLVEPEPLPGDVAPVAEEIAMPVGEVIATEIPVTEAEVFEDDSQLFPTIPLTTYKETASDEGVVAVEPEIEMALETEVAEEPVSDSTAVAGGELGDLDYGIVRKGDNLWTIAEKLRQDDDSVTIYQVMMALLRSNPDAFVDGNVNRLKVGHVLRIEDPTMLVEISAAEAAQEYQSQTAAWEEYSQSVAQTTGEQPIIGSEMAETESAMAETGGELTLSSPDAIGGELQGGTGTMDDAVSNDIVTLQDELRQVRQDASTMRGRNSELNNKLRELEEELSSMQRSISVKDDELAALQQQLSELKGGVAEQIATEESATQMEQEAVQLAEMPAEIPAEEEIAQAAPRDITTDTGLAQTEAEAVTEEPMLAEETEVVIESDSMQTEMAEMAEEPMDATTEAQVQEPVPVTQPSVITPPVQPAEEGVLDIIMGAFDVVGDTLSGIFGSIAGDSLLIFIALPILLVLIIVMFIMIRRRNKTGDNYQESILSGEPASEMNSVTSAEASEEESSFLSDFAVSGAGAIQTEDSEVDPLTEADVFMAYGRYEAAEERLKEAIEAEPARQELKLKLIELYYSTKNKPAFENAAEDFYASVGDNASEDPSWQKVASMGAELVPGNPIFSGSTAAPVASMSEDISDTSSVSLTDSQVMDIGLDTGVFAASDFSPEAESAATEMSSDDMDIDSGVMEFNLGTNTEPVEVVSDTSSDATAVDSEGPDFSLDIDEDIGSPEELTDDSLLDFNIDVGASTEAATTEDTSDAMDFSLDVGDAEASSDSGALDFDLDLGTGPADVSAADLTLDEGDAGSTAPEPSLDFELNASDAGDLDIGGDEVGTKLDLAKAYIDMGDPDGAKSILDEVMGEGNDSQKSEAEELLQQIG